MDKHVHRGASLLNMFDKHLRIQQSNDIPEQYFNIYNREEFLKITLSSQLSHIKKYFFLTFPFFSLEPSLNT